MVTVATQGGKEEGREEQMEGEGEREERGRTRLDRREDTDPL